MNTEEHLKKLLSLTPEVISERIPEIKRRLSEIESEHEQLEEELTSLYKIKNNEYNIYRINGIYIIREKFDKMYVFTSYYDSTINYRSVGFYPQSGFIVFMTALENPNYSYTLQDYQSSTNDVEKLDISMIYDFLYNGITPE